MAQFLSRSVRRILRPLVQLVDRKLEREMGRWRKELEELKILQGRALAFRNAERAPLASLRAAEFKVFSQFGEDGILQYLIREVGIEAAEQTFVEFGVEDYAESNTRFLLMNDNWRGLIIDGSPENMDDVRGQDLYWRHDLTAVAAWIDRDNINTLIDDAGFRGRIGVLSVDINGNDYWVWERITVVDPVIVVVEWNSVFGPRHAVTVPYDPAFDLARAHHSCLYWGASIRALERLGARKGYALVGSESAGANLFFVRRDRLGRLRALPVEEAYVESRFRGSRDPRGRLTFLSGARRTQEILDLPLMEIEVGRPVTLRELSSS